MDGNGDLRDLITEAIQKAIAASQPSAREWHVCVRNPDGEDLISFMLGSYAEVEKLARDMRRLGYELKLLHPVHTQCDFVLEPVKSSD